MKSYKNLTLPLICLLVVPGCLFKKNGVEVEKKPGKKVALTDSGKGIPLGTEDQSGGKYFDGGVEAFVVDGFESEDEDLRDEFNFDAEKEMRLARADKNAEEQWRTGVDSKDEDSSFEPIFFSFDSDEIREDQVPTLAFDTEQAKRAAQERILVVQGHADSHFVSEPYNIATSERRARRVAAHLEKAGIAKEKIKVLAFGDKDKLVDTREKEEKNRRVVIKETDVAAA